MKKCMVLCLLMTAGQVYAMDREKASVQRQKDEQRKAEEIANQQRWSDVFASDEYKNNSIYARVANFSFNEEQMHKAFERQRLAEQTKKK